jgi:hypothetical protein
MTALVIAVHGVAAAVLALALPPVAGLAVACLLALSSGLAVRRDTLLVTGDAPSSLELGVDREVVAHLRGGSALRGVAPRSYVSRWLVVLDLVRPDASRRTILVARDMLPAREFRLLRLWALWGGVPAGGVRCVE